MAITGNLSEFSLPELFQFLEQGQKTGLLTLSSLPDPSSGTQRNHHIWFRQGRIVAAANRLDNQGLISLMDSRGFMTSRAAAKVAEICSIQTPMGLCLKSQGLLTAEQLKLLFYVQVMRQVCALFTLEEASFNFDNQADLPMAEMTGLSTPGNEVTLAGLRALKNWSALADKLPDPTSGLIGIVDRKPDLPLNHSEWQIWEFAQGTVALKDIAEQLRLSVEKVQQIVFRLIVVGIAEEVPLVAAAAATPKSLPEIAIDDNIASKLAETPQASEAPKESEAPKLEGLSQSFLQNLVGFLRDRT